jgi:hypothetical protein
MLVNACKHKELVAKDDIIRTELLHKLLHIGLHTYMALRELAGLFEPELLPNSPSGSSKLSKASPVGLLYAAGR